jgi:spore coat protein U-like protein
MDSGFVGYRPACATAPISGTLGVVDGVSVTLDGMSHRVAVLRVALLLATVLAMPTAARSQTCSFDFGSGIGPVAYDPTVATPSDSCVTFTFECSNAKKATVTLSTGNSGSYGSREMTQGASVLSYNLFTDATYASVFGDGTLGTGTKTVQKTGPIEVCLRIDPEQWVEAGAYGDSITMTLNF